MTKLSITRNFNPKPGSALLLTVMVIAILTTTSLASIAVRFDQLASTDKIANAAVAKSAADSALVKLKENLANGNAISPTITDLNTNTEASLSTTTPFRPNPRKIVATYQKAQATLPRCLAVAVLNPWANDGQYQFSNQNGSNPALLFNYANIVNDSPLGIIPGNDGLVATDKAKTIAQFTNMGHFYNPYAPTGANQNNPNYWSVNLGGPQDQFLTKHAPDGVSSYYKNLDFIYVPYLPRWVDSGLATTTPGTGTDRYSAAQLQSLFESTIKNNNFKVWIDASVDDDTIAKYGFGDLFASDSTYRLKWLQPSLWNDTPETAFATPYRADDLAASSLSWNQKPTHLMPAGSDDPGWGVTIVKGAKPVAFIKLTSSQSSTSFSPGASISGLIYGSLEGLRLNQKLVAFRLLGKDLAPLQLNDRTNDQGWLYGINITAIGPKTSSNGVDSIPISFTLSNNGYDTPQLTSPARAPTGADIDTIAVSAEPQFSTLESTQGVTIKADRVTIDINSSCIANAAVINACPAVGDLINLKKAAVTPVWGKVVGANYTNSGHTLSTITVDSLRQTPLPVSQLASTYYTSGGSPRIAYFGGAIDMNQYDGGYASESSQLWLYDPEADSWSYPTQTVGSLPGGRAGASMVFDSVNNRLVVIGGYYHEPTLDPSSGLDCQISQPVCLATNRPGIRIAKHVTNDVYAYNLTSSSWEKLDYSVGWGKIANGTTYTARVTSTFADRSGLDGWKYTARVSGSPTLNLTGGSSLLTLTPSAAGVSKGDSVYIHGTKTDGSNWYGWANVTAVDYPASQITVVVYGTSGEASVSLSSLAVQILNRTNITNSCTGGSDGTYYSCTFNDTTGYAVGDSVVLESYTSGDAQLNATLAGFISYIDTSGKAYFVADERNSVIKDFSDQAVGRVAGDSAVAFPAARFGATFALQPTATSRASYWQGVAAKASNYHRFADLWNVQFLAGTGAASAVWSFQTTDNPINAAALTTGNYSFQVLRPSYIYQFSTTTNTTNNPALTPGSSGWDNSAHYPLEINSADSTKAVVGAWATLERRLSTGARETFHGIVDDIYNAPPGSCGSYADTKLCLRHNGAYPNDSGFGSNAASVKVTLMPSFDFNQPTIGTFKGNVASGVVTMQNVTNLGALPAVGGLVQITSKSGVFPADSYSFIVNNRSFNNSNKTFTFSYDKLTASPDPLGFSTSQITSQGGTDRLLTLTNSQLGYDNVGAPEWVKDATTGSTSSWKVRLAGKYSNHLYRPANRQGGAVATLYNSSNQTSQTYLVGGAVFGQYATMWQQTNSGATATGSAAWQPRLVSATAGNDLSLLAGGSLVVYQNGSTTRAVYFGGKQPTNLGSGDYGRSVGPFVEGRPDSGNFNVSDNTFTLADNSNGTDAATVVNTIQTNLPSLRPSGIDNSLEFRSGPLGANQSVCAYIGQTNCSSKLLLTQLGNLGRLDTTNTNSTYNGWSSGRSALLTDLGTAFKQQTVAGTAKPSLIFSTPTLSGADVNGRYDQEGYRPYLKDDGDANQVPYGTLGSDFGSDKTAGLVAFSTITGGGAVLVTTTGVGNAVTNNRGGNNDSSGRAYSYCAVSDTTVSSGNYSCNANATRKLTWLPDSEDVLFTLDAALALAATDTYKVTGYYGGVKRGYIVVSRTGSQPTVYEVAP